ncbi:SET domain-containing protein 5 [Fulvia fulva]|nr:SET domain-containing protein 5 [Fulvia fulva]
MSAIMRPDAPFEFQLSRHKGYGLFATRDIKAGTRVICEKALIATPTVDTIDTIVTQLEAISPEQRELYTELSYHKRAVNTKQRSVLRKHLATQHQYTGKALDAALEDYVKMAAIYFTNAVQMGGKAQWGAGLFLTYSRVNHSCRPNLANTYNATLGMLTVHATRDIKAGEELTTTYILNVRTKEQRQEQLQTGWGFKCQCELCTGHDKEVAASETRRERMFEIDQGLAIFENNNPLIRSHAPGSFPKSTLEALAWSEELVSLLKQEQIFGMDLAQTYRECSKYSLAEGLYSKAIGYAKAELDVEKVCVGEETEHLKEGMEGAVFWMRHLENLGKGEMVRMRMCDKRNKKEVQKAERKKAKKGGGWGEVRSV